MKCILAFHGLSPAPRHPLPSHLFCLFIRYMVRYSIQVFLLGGDQQTFSRICWLLRFYNDGKYNMIVPFVGDFHAVVHMLMAIHIL